MTKFIAIDGKGGSGKTYLSSILAHKLGAKLYDLDDYGNDYQPFVGIPKLIDELKNTSDEIVIFEGVGVFHDCFDFLNPFRIFVSVPHHIRQKRAANRDVPRVDRSAQEWQKIWAIWDIAEKDYFTPELISKADIVVGEVDGNFDIEKIISAWTKIKY